MITSSRKVRMASIAILWCFVALPGRLEAGCSKHKQISGSDDLRRRFLARLNEGGLVIVLRHASKEQEGEPVPIDSGDLCLQKNQPLYAPGRAQALSLQSAFRKLDVKFEQVLHSQVCRSKQTAHLIFGTGPDQPIPKENQNLNPGAGKDWLGCLIRSSIAEGNVLLVTHSNNLNDLGQRGLTVDEPKDHGIAAVFDPAASDQEDRFLGCISPNDWVALANTEGI